MAADDWTVVRAGRSQPLPDCTGGEWQYAWGSRPRTVRRSLSALRRSRRDVDGSRYAMVEPASAVGTNPAIAVADATRDPLALERYSASADARESGAVPRIAATRLGTARPAAGAPASLAGCVSLGTQLHPSP